MKRKWELVRQASQTSIKKILKDFPRLLKSVVLGIIYHKNHTNYQIIKSKKSLKSDNLGRKQKKETKSQKLAAKQFRSAKFRRGCKISQPLRNCQGLLLLPLIFLLIMSFAFWFCGSEFQLISSCLSWTRISNI